MNIAQLIEKLQTLDPTMEVLMSAEGAGGEFQTLDAEDVVVLNTRPADWSDEGAFEFVSENASGASKTLVIA